MTDNDKVFMNALSSDPQEILAELQKVKEALEPLRAAIEEAKALKDSFNTDIKIHQKAIDELRQKQSEIDSKVYDERARMRKLERDLQAANTRYEQSVANRAAREKFDALADEFDRLTMGAPWREFAFDHQIQGAKRLAVAKRAILADKRGLGKSLTSLVWTDMVQSQKVLAIVPNDTIGNFIREIEHWAPHRMIVNLSGLPKSQRDTLMNVLLPGMPNFIAVLNYEAWRRDDDFITALLGIRFDTIILDEAHTAKNTRTKTYQGIRRLITSNNACPQCKSPNIASGLMAPVCNDCNYKSDGKTFFEFNSFKNVLPMTGTPIMNRPQDLFALLSIIDPVEFRSEVSFLRAYCWQDFDQKWRFRSGGLESLTKQLASRFVMRDRKSAGVIIPPQTIQYYDLVLDSTKYPDQARVAARLNQQAILEIEEGKGITLPYVLQLITRKRQIMTWAQGVEFKDRDGAVVYRANCTESVKLDRVIDNQTGNGPEGLIPELIGALDPDTSRWIDGERVIVFSAFNAPLRELSRRLDQAKIPHAMMVGETSTEERDEIVKDFDAKVAPVDYKYQVVLCNYNVGGQGLNLTGASQMIMIDEIWNPGRMDQAFGRIDRMGQTKETTVHVLRVQGSVDSWMRALIKGKQDMIDGFEDNINLVDEFKKALLEGEF
jgi:SNF2 family DNA or RNA helicase